MTQLIRSHCGPDRAAKAVHQVSLAHGRSMSVFDHERASGIRAIADLRVRTAVTFIESRKGRDVSPDEAAASVGLSSRQLARLFGQEVGMSPKRFILETRLRYVRFLLENSPTPITVAALKTGFSDSAPLATRFRKKFGLTLRACRNRPG